MQFAQVKNIFIQCLPHKVVFYTTSCRSSCPNCLETDISAVVVQRYCFCHAFSQLKYLKNYHDLIYLNLVEETGEKDFMIGNTEHDVQFRTSSCCQKRNVVRNIFGKLSLLNSRKFELFKVLIRGNVANVFFFAVTTITVKSTYTVQLLLTTVACNCRSLTIVSF